MGRVCMAHLFINTHSGFDVIYLLQTVILSFTQLGVYFTWNGWIFCDKIFFRQYIYTHVRKKLPFWQLDHYSVHVTNVQALIETALYTYISTSYRFLFPWVPYNIDASSLYTSYMIWRLKPKTIKDNISWFPFTPDWYKLCIP